MARNDGQILIEDARILFRNFAGAEDKYNAAGDRNFCVLIDEVTAKKLIDDGWNVKTLKSREEGDPEEYYLKVAVSFKNRPPKLVLISSRGRNDYDESRCDVFDWVDIAKADLIVVPYFWEVGGKSGTKAYLRSLFVTVEEDELDQKYADVKYAEEDE